LIGTEDRADGGVQLALLGVETVTRVAVDLLELAAVFLDHGTQLRALRVVEANFGRQTVRRLRRHACRAAGAAYERRRTAGPAPARKSPPIRPTEIVWRLSRPSRKIRNVTPEDEAAGAAKTEHGEHEEREPDPRAVIVHGWPPAA
jgi:hypothetical protein